MRASLPSLTVMIALAAALAGRAHAAATPPAAKALSEASATAAATAPAPATATASAASPAPTSAAPVPTGPTPTAAAAAPAAAVAAPAAPPPLASTTTTRRVGVLRDPAPRPTTDVRVQSRFATKAKTAQLFAAGEYLSRGDFYNSPGARVGATYYPLEPFGLELQASHYWSSLNAEAERIKQTLGALPDSHAPEWLLLAGGRYSIGYGKLMIGGLGGAIHFEPQAFVHAGMHINNGDIGPSGDVGLGLLVFLTPKFFARIDAAIVYERESRSGQSVAVWGTLPSLGVGGTL
jgi:hypothetical protein